MPKFTVEKRKDGNGTRWRFIKADGAICAVILDNKYANKKEARAISILKFKYAQDAAAAAQGKKYIWSVVKEKKDKQSA